MKHVLTAVFDKRGDAQHALNKLFAAGFERADATLSLAPTAAHDSTDGTVQGLGASGKHRFTRLLGIHAHDRPEGNPEAGAGAMHVLTLTTQSDTQARRAAELIGQLSADGEIDRLRDIRSVSGPTKSGQRGRSLQDTHLTGYRADEASGVAAPASVQAADEIAARRYGSAMHASEKYRNRSWDEVGHELLQDWKLRHPAMSDQDGTALAIHRGWDATSPEIDEDSYYRTHWGARYAHAPSDNQDHAAAAMRANRARNSFQYHLRDWTAGAAGRKANWASQHPDELRPWARFKDVLLHGWSRISLGNDEHEDTHPGRFPGGRDTGFDDAGPVYRDSDDVARPHK